MPIIKKYSAHLGDSFLAGKDNKKMLFDSPEAAKEFVNNLPDVRTEENLVAENMILIPGWDAWGLFKQGVEVWAKIYGITWSQCTADKWGIDDFTCGHFRFLVDESAITATIGN